MAENEPNPQNQENQTPQQIIIQKIYSKDVSFEAPNSPQIFTNNNQPEIKVDLNTAVSVLDDSGVYEVVLRITVTAILEENTAFLAEVHQAGIFNVTGFDKETLDGMLGSYCPNILFPYARENISELVTKGGFPQLILQPVNFDAMYAQHKKAQSEASSEQENPSKTEIH